MVPSWQQSNEGDTGKELRVKNRGLTMGTKKDN